VGGAVAPDGLVFERRLPTRRSTSSVSGLRGSGEISVGIVSSLSATRQNSAMPQKEASARIKINKLLEAAGWRFVDDANAPANISLEPNVTLTRQQVDARGDDFQTSSNGFIDFLLLDDKGFPWVAPESKAEGKNQLTGKEQARKYAKSQNCRFAIPPYGNLHYWWDEEQGNPHIVTKLPVLDSIDDMAKSTKRLFCGSQHIMNADSVRNIAPQAIDVYDEYAAILER